MYEAFSVSLMVSTTLNHFCEVQGGLRTPQPDVLANISLKHFGSFRKWR